MKYDHDLSSLTVCEMRRRRRIDTGHWMMEEEVEAVVSWWMKILGLMEVPWKEGEQVTLTYHVRVNEVHHFWNFYLEITTMQR
jgi:hypothetical protein